MKLALKELRKRAGLTQRELAKRLNVDWRTYGSWERQERMLSLSQACDIADELNCTLDELIGREVTPEMRRNSKEAQALLDAREVLEQAIKASGYENLGDVSHAAETEADDSFIDKEGDVLSDGNCSSKGKSMVDFMYESSNEEGAA